MDIGFEFWIRFVLAYISWYHLNLTKTRRIERGTEWEMLVSQMKILIYLRWIFLGKSITIHFGWYCFDLVWHKFELNINDSTDGSVEEVLGRFYDIERYYSALWIVIFVIYILSLHLWKVIFNGETEK